MKEIELVNFVIERKENDYVAIIKRHENISEELCEKINTIIKKELLLKLSVPLVKFHYNNISEPLFRICIREDEVGLPVLDMQTLYINFLNETSLKQIYDLFIEYISNFVTK